MELNVQDTTTDPRTFGGEGIVDDAAETDEEMATEEEQLDYDLITVRARKMIFGQGKEKILTVLGSAETPSQGMGQAASMLVKSLQESAKAAGRPLSDEAALAAGTEIIEDLNELAKAKGVYTYDSNEEEVKEVSDALLWGVKYYGDGMIANGEIPPEMQKAAQKEVTAGIAEENNQQPKQTPIAAGVGQAVNSPPGLVGGQMGGM